MYRQQGHAGKTCPPGKGILRRCLGWAPRVLVSLVCVVCAHFVLSTEGHLKPRKTEIPLIRVHVYSSGGRLLFFSGWSGVFAEQRHIEQRLRTIVESVAWADRTRLSESKRALLEAQLESLRRRHAINAGQWRAELSAVCIELYTVDALLRARNEYNWARNQ